MTKKISIGVTLIISIASVVISSVVTGFLLINTYSDLLVDLPERAEQYAKLSDMDELIRKEYYGEIDSELMDISLASGMVGGLKDPYSFYISSDDFQFYSEYTQGKLYGTGINSYYDSESDCLFISYVDMYSPAHIAGIKEGYFIISVNGDKVNSENASDLSNKLSEGYDKKVKIEYSENIDRSDILNAELTCGYRYPTCDYCISGNVGYVHFSSFYEDTHTVFSSAIEHFKANSISAIIIDLRNCTGNDFDSAAKVIDLIVPVASEGTASIYTAKNADNLILSRYSSDANSLNMSIAVLMNSRTESAAELFACDLRDFGKAILIGETTAGHGTMQKLFSLQDGGAVSLTVAEIYPYISDSFDGKGVSPDIEINSTESFKNNLNFTDFSNDEQYNKAYSYLTGSENKS